MAIYLCFIQHILWSLKDDGKAAIVVPTGFITGQQGIEKNIRQKIIEKRWLKGVISMPASIFANTGTNVSVLFIDKSNKSGEIMLVDASKLGTKVKEGKNQRTVLSDEEIQRIENAFINCEVIDDFSVKVNYEQIENKNYSFSAGQYFEVKIQHIDITADEFNAKISGVLEGLDAKFKQSRELEKNIMDLIGGLKI